MAGDAPALLKYMTPEQLFQSTPAMNGG